MRTITNLNKRSFNKLEQIYTTTVAWEGDHWGNIKMGNGPEMKFSAPPDAFGHAGVLTPEDAFVGALNTCYMMMFLWACERFKINLVNYSCTAKGKKVIFLDHTEQFTEVTLQPKIEVKKTTKDKIEKLLKTAEKYSLVANSIKSQLIIEPTIIILD